MSAVTSEDAACVETPESVSERMDAADRALAAELGIAFDYNSTPAVLVEMAQRSAFDETKVAMEWYAAYSAWCDWAFEWNPGVVQPLASRKAT